MAFREEFIWAVGQGGRKGGPRSEGKILGNGPRNPLPTPTPTLQMFIIKSLATIDDL